MSYSAGACLHAFALFACESHSLFYLCYIADESTIGVTNTTGQKMTLQHGIVPCHQSTTGTSICKESSQSLLLVV